MSRTKWGLKGPKSGTAAGQLVIPVQRVRQHPGGVAEREHAEHQSSQPSPSRGSQVFMPPSSDRGARDRRVRAARSQRAPRRPARSPAGASREKARHKLAEALPSVAEEFPPCVGDPRRTRVRAYALGIDRLRAASARPCCRRRAASPACPAACGPRARRAAPRGAPPRACARGARGARGRRRRAASRERGLRDHVAPEIGRRSARAPAARAAAAPRRRSPTRTPGNSAFENVPT